MLAKQNTMQKYGVWMAAGLLFCTASLKAQESIILSGITSFNGGSVALATIQAGKHSTLSDSTGFFSIAGLSKGKYSVKITSAGFLSQQIPLLLNKDTLIQLVMQSNEAAMDEVVVTGTLKEVKRYESPVPVEVYSPAFFKRNPTPSIFESLQNINGVRPQINCNVCNTGDIHMNGLEGPYTMVLIDGMPIVSALSTVYGLSGIPNSLVERMEIVKGPASSLYGSEAVGGLINIITKKPGSAPRIALDIMATGFGDINTDLSFKLKHKKIQVLTGINYFIYDKPVDNNNDNFTDVTLQNRVSVFQKWSVDREQNRNLSVASRFFYEDRWGGDMRWNKNFRGGDSIYGESIYTTRWELLGSYRLPVKEDINLSVSYNNHLQNSRYGTVAFDATQKIFFSQLTWNKTLQSHSTLAGLAVRKTSYDDNTAATINPNKNIPQTSWLPGIFIQDEIRISERHTLLTGLRYDYNSVHGNIYTPRLAYKWSINHKNIIRLNAGTGYRVVNLFTEDHAALTGARTVVVKNALKPEKTINTNINLLKKFYFPNGTFASLDMSAWYTYFYNRITADLESDPDKIIYDNLKGHAISKGISANLDLVFSNGLKIIAGCTLQDVYNVTEKIKQRLLLTEKFSGTWSASYKIKKWQSVIDYTGNIYGPMRLPLLSDTDPRRPNSPHWSIQNIQFSFSGIKKLEIYCGIKNILNFTPAKNNSFIIARSHDPFDKQLQYDSNNKILITPENPYGLSFDPNYVYAPNQGIRMFAGVRFTVRQ